MPALFDFTGGVLPPGATIARAAGPWSRTAESKLIVTGSAADTPRFDHDPTTGALRGLLIEPAGTNLALDSEDFTSPRHGRIGVTVIADQGVSPAGVQTADLVIPTTATAARAITTTSTISLPIGGRITRSYYVKAAGVSIFKIRPLSAFSTTGTVQFSLVTGEARQLTFPGGTTADALIWLEAIGSGWYRAALSGVARQTYNNQPDSDRTAPQVNFTDSNFGEDTTAGDGIAGMLMWGQQVEMAAAPTTYVPVIGAGPATRPAEALRLESPSGNYLVTFDDGSTQNLVLVEVGGAVTLTAAQLARPRIRSIFHTVPAITPAGRSARLSDTAARSGRLADTSARSATLLS